MNRVINDAGTGLRFTGGYLYFPPGNYFLKAAIVIWPKMTMIFAPNAILTMPEFGETTGRNRAEASVQIQGGIQAGLHQIVNSTITNGLPNNRGGLMFQTDTVKEVYPEWWGAESMDVRHSAPFDSSDAIQSTLDAAINDIDPGANTGSAIPVVLTGSYLITRPLLIGRRPWVNPGSVSESNPFVLRGKAGPSPPVAIGSTLKAHRDFPRRRGGTEVEPLSAEHHMLVVNGPAGFLIENIQFDAGEQTSSNNDVRPRAFGCLRLEKGIGGVGRPDNTSAQMSRVRRCIFKDGVVNLVQVGPFHDPYQSVFVRNDQGGQDLLGLVFEACKFVQIQVPPPGAAGVVWATQAERHGWLRDGAYVRANNTLRLHFIDCFWNGMMRAGIRTYSGSITLTNCNFHLTRLPVPSTICADQNRRYSGVGDGLVQTQGALDPLRVFVDARDNGCDIYIEVLAAEVRHPSGGVAATAVESQSWRFLSSYPQTTAVNAMMGVNGTDSFVNLPSYEVYLQDVHASNASDSPLAGADVSAMLKVHVPPVIEFLGPFFYGSSLTVSGLHVANHPQRVTVAGLIESFETTTAVFSRWSQRCVMGPLPPNAPRSRLINLGARTGIGYELTPRQFRDPLVTAADPLQVFYKVGTDPAGPLPITSTANTSWYLNLQVAPVPLPGGP